MKVFSNSLLVYKLTTQTVTGSDERASCFNYIIDLNMFALNSLKPPFLLVSPCEEAAEVAVMQTQL